jgi:hypothetical protein
MATRWRTETMPVSEIENNLDEWSLEGWHIHSIVGSSVVVEGQEGEAPNSIVHVIGFREELGL